MSKYEKIIFIVFVALCLLIIGFFVFKSVSISDFFPLEDELQNVNREEGAVNEEEGRDLTGSEVKIENKQDIEETDNISILVNYPKFDSPASAKIEGYALSRIDSFKSSLREFNAPSGSIFTLDINYEVKYLGDEYVSFLFRENTYTGGAHPNQIPVGKTYEIESGQEVSLTDIFVPGSGYLEAISKEAVEKFKEKFKEGVFFSEGVEARTVNFETFTIDDGSITFYFAPYQIAPYAAGLQDVRIPFEKLRTHLQPEFEKII